MKRLSSLTFIVILLLALAHGRTVWGFSNLYIFGDSLSDQGTIYTLSSGLVPPPEYSGGGVSGRFTNGENYVDYLAPMLGLNSMSFAAGGTNYAFGGARTYYHPELGFAGSLWGQYLIYDGTHATSDPDALYIVWAGANNLKDMLLPPSPLPVPVPTLTRTAMDVALVVGLLAGSGAQNILVPNLPDLGIVPIITGGGSPNPTATLLSAMYNSILDSLLDSLSGFNLMRFDTFSFVDDVYYNPGKYGLTNVMNQSYSKFVEPGGTVTGNPDEYLSWDGFHPTTAAHRLLAAQMYQAVVPEPSSLLLAVSGLVVGILFCRRKQLFY